MRLLNIQYADLLTALIVRTSRTGLQPGVRCDDLRLLGILFLCFLHRHQKVCALNPGSHCPLLICHYARSKHILQNLIVLSVNMGLLLWQVAKSYFRCMIPNSHFTSLVTVVTIVLVL